MKKIVLVIIILSFATNTLAKKKMSAAQAERIGTRMGKEQDAKANKDLQTSDLTSVNDQADKSSGSNQTGALIATVAGAALIVKGKALMGSTYARPAGVILLAMGLLALKQSQENAGVSFDAYNSGLQTDAYGNGIYDTGMDKINGFPEVKDLNKNLKFLSEDKSLSYDPKAGTLKLGDKTLKPSDVSSKASMAAAGLPSSLIDQAWSEAEKASQDAEKKVAALDKDNHSGGGGSGVTDIVIVEDGAGEDAYGNNGNNGNNKQFRDPAGVAGMSKSYYGTPIGVAMDNIFLMMNRRYVVKDKQNTFFGKSETPANP